MAANLDSMAECAGASQHLCKTLGLFLRLLTYNGFRIAAAVPDITSRFKA